MATDKSLIYSFIWKIENFSLCYYKNGERMTSPVFEPEILKGSRWTIFFYPKGMSSSYLDYISCYLQRIGNDNCNETIIIDFTIEISGGDGKSLGSDTFRNISFTPGHNLGQPQILKTSKAADTLIITCHLFSDLKQFECVANTKFAERKQSFLWNIKIPGEALTELKLISFSDNLQFEISVTAPDNDIKIVIYMKTNKSSLKRNLVCEIALLDLKGNEVASRSATHLFETENDRFEYPVFITKKQLMDNRSCYIEDDCFSLWCSLSVSDGIEYSAIQGSKTDSLSRATSIQNLQEDFLNMFSHKKHADVQLRVNDEIIPAHKSVLSARSAVFDAMFSQDMVENKTGIVEILDVDINIMKCFLEYLYAGVAKNMNYENAKKLLILADKYQVNCLKEQCADFLISSKSLRNVCDIFIIADLVVHERLKMSAMEYIIANSSKVFVSLEWSELVKNNPRLASDVFSNISANFKFIPLNKSAE